MEPEIKTGANVEARAVEVPAAAPAPTREDMVKRVEEIGLLLRRTIMEVKRLPRDKALEPHQDEVRCLAQAQTQLQIGLMWLRRAITPTRDF